MNRYAGPKLLAGIASVAVLATLMAIAGCDQSRAKQQNGGVAAPEKLVILTPHNEKIRYAFAAGFSSWYLEKHKKPVSLTWVYRGTPECVEYVRDIPQMRSAGGPFDDPDVLFGGSVTDIQALAEEGCCAALKLGDDVAHIPETVHGWPTRDADGRWFAAGLSSFGILINQLACDARNIAAPATWADLADPRFHGWLGVADPRASGSHRQCMVLTLQHQGWEQGWSTIARVLGNTRALCRRSSDALALVESGNALATFAVNFDGAARAAESDGALAYADPEGATAVMPGIISVMSTSRNADLARDFVRYVLSEEGQSLWIVEREHRAQPGATLYHYAIDPTIYEKKAEQLSLKQDPFAADFGFKYDAVKAQDEVELIDFLVPAMCGSNHVVMQRAWQAVVAAGLPEDAVAKLTAPPVGEGEAAELLEQLRAADAEKRSALAAEWSDRFGERYADVLEMVGQ